MENGMEADTAQWTRLRREFDITIEPITVQDRQKLRDFVAKVTGAVEFVFSDDSDPTSTEELIVKFASLPQYVDKDNTATGKRFTCTFTLREV